MAESAFTRVKKAIPAQADAILAEFGVKHHKEGTKLKGEWTTGFLCPLCGDKSGSASFTHELYLKCHQCGTKADVFEWLSRHTGKKAWDLCKQLAERMTLALPKGRRAARTARAMPARMTEDLLQAAVIDLWEHPDAETMREELASRKLEDQQMFADLEIGWIRGWMVFASRDDKGRLHDRYRGWNPGNPKLRFMWFGQGTGGPGIWPCRPAPEGNKILLMEGESDTLTAWMRLRLHEHGWHPCTWTAGATSCPNPKDIPRSFHGKEVHIAYDNDVFQGPDYQNYYVETKPGKDPAHARVALEQRLKNLLLKLTPMLESLNCDVVIRQCPIDPKKKFGGDFRDWVNEGGRDLSDWKAFPCPDLPAYGKMVLELPFSEVFSHPHKLIRTRVQVEAIARDDVTLSRVFEQRCEMGMHPSCAICPGARNFPDGIIDMTDFQRDLAVGLDQQNVTDKIIKDVIQRPRGCPRVEVVGIDVRSGSEWRGCQPGKVEDSTQRSLHVFSEDPPSLSGEMEVEGVCYPNIRGNGMVMLATDVRQLDKAEVDLAPVLHDLRMECPCFSDRIEDIDAYLDKRSRDFAWNVTRIYGRRDIHVSHDLLMHSVRRANLWGAIQRAWLDICIFGDTRTGKSLTVRRLFEFHGLGVHHTAVSNISRAGIVMGAGKDGLMKPGLMPRCNGKALMLDELHFLVQNNPNEHPMSWLQSARDDGVASGVKIYGNRDLPAQVRLICIANWMRNRRRSYEFGCEHLGALYGAPETLSRLDFGLMVEGKPDQPTLDREEQWWTKDRTRALILRAWAQDPEQVIIDEGAMDMAKEKCREWDGLYDCEQLPLFTPEEKSASVMRIAIAIANVCFSHPQNDPYCVHVREVHALWAARWLELTWKKSGYDLYSQKRQDGQRILKPFEVEKQLMIRLDLSDPIVAESMLGNFLTPFAPSEIATLTGTDPFQAGLWLSKMVALHLFERMRAANGYNVQYQLTRGGAELIHNMMRMASEDEKQWFERFNIVRMWQGPTEPNLIPMTATSWEIFHDSASSTGTDDISDEVPF